MCSYTCSRDKLPLLTENPVRELRVQTFLSSPTSVPSSHSRLDLDRLDEMLHFHWAHGKPVTMLATQVGFGDSLLANRCSGPKSILSFHNVNSVDFKRVLSLPSVPTQLLHAR